eukprot:163206-Chlamydomonas_euryale.AAC.7
MLATRDVVATPFATAANTAAGCAFPASGPSTEPASWDRGVTVTCTAPSPVLPLGLGRGWAVPSRAAAPRLQFVAAAVGEGRGMTLLGTPPTPPLKFEAAAEGDGMGATPLAAELTLPYESAPAAGVARTGEAPRAAPQELPLELTTAAHRDGTSAKPRAAPPRLLLEPAAAADAGGSAAAPRAALPRLLLLRSLAAAAAATAAPSGQGPSSASVLRCIHGWYAPPPNGDAACGPCSRCTPPLGVAAMAADARGCRGDTVPLHPPAAAQRCAADAELRRAPGALAIGVLALSPSARAVPPCCKDEGGCSPPLTLPHAGCLAATSCPCPPRQRWLDASWHVPVAAAAVEAP